MGTLSLDIMSGSALKLTVFYYRAAILMDSDVSLTN